LQVGQLRAEKQGEGLPGTMIDQRPTPGTVVERGATIDLVVLLFKAER
jgi:beta-lactam-binding protein with PASTA domain